MLLVRSVVAKVSNNLQYCRSIRNRQSRELCTSLRNNTLRNNTLRNNTDGNSSKEPRGVSVLSDLYRKGVGLAIEYGPYAALPLVGWYAISYADRDREETKKRVLKLDTEIQDRKAERKEESNKLELAEKRAEEREKRAEEREKREEEMEKRAEEREKREEEMEKRAEEMEKRAEEREKRQRLESDMVQD